VLAIALRLSHKLRFLKNRGAFLFTESGILRSSQTLDEKLYFRLALMVRGVQACISRTIGNMTSSESAVFTCTTEFV
jgi:hypothetical protein